MATEPILSQSAAELEDVVASYEQAVDAGNPPSPEELLTRHPHLAAELRDYFDIDRLVAPLRSPKLVTEPAPSFGNYELLGRIAEGGMGVVYRARQVRPSRLVAVKMIRDRALASPDDLERFRREAENVAHLDHPHIVPVYEVGEYDGHPFFSMKLVEGGSLDKRLDGTPRPPEEAAALVAALARGMQAAHRQGVIHRDLKPANVLLSRKPDAASAATSEASLSTFEPKVTDFGLAKQLDEHEGGTADGAVLGTPSYMAPEQAAGQVKQVGPLADVYALTAILYELLTGRPPFMGTTQRQTLLQVCEQEPVPPRRLQPSAPRDLEVICLKGLRKEPRRRYADAAALADDLQRFLDGRPLPASRPGRGRALGGDLRPDPLSGRGEGRGRRRGPSRRDPRRQAALPRADRRVLLRHRRTGDHDPRRRGGRVAPRRRRLHPPRRPAQSQRRPDRPDRLHPPRRPGRHPRGGMTPPARIPPHAFSSDASTHG
jgi:tRNA A-37 threonylcarbamoyl transferase component Bud32